MYIFRSIIKQVSDVKSKPMMFRHFTVDPVLIFGEIFHNILVVCGLLDICFS